MSAKDISGNATTRNSDKSEPSRQSVDPLSGAQHGIDQAHERIHAGQAFQVGIFDDVTTGANLDILIITSDTHEAHIIHDLVVEADALFDVYEGTITSDNGTPLPIYNCRRRLPVPVAKCLAFSAPTVTTIGDKIIPQHKIFAGSGGNASGGGFGVREESILRVSTKHLFRFNNPNAQTKALLQILSFYEKLKPV